MEALKKVLFPAPGDSPWPHRVYMAVMLVLMGVGIGCVSLLLASSFFGRDGGAIFFNYFKHPHILALNLLPPILLVLLFWFLFGRAGAAFGTAAGIVLGFSVANFYKIQLRDDPLLAIDLTTVGEAGDILSRYQLTFHWKIGVTIFAVVFGLLFAHFLMRGRPPGRRVRAIGAAAVLVCGAACAPLYANDTLYDEQVAGTELIDIWSDMQVYVSKGFVYPFLHSIPDAFPHPPEGYDEEQAQALLGAYEDGTIEEDEQVNIISIMLEAYMDLSVFENDRFQLSQDLYAPLHELQAECVSGPLVTNIFAGGTKDTEQGFLTGYTDPGTYRSPVNTYVWYLRSQGYTTEGFHPGGGWFYNRKNVNEYFGFERYLFVEDFEVEDRSDEFFFSELKEMWESRDKSAPYFNYSLSFQNHGGYDTTSTGEVSYVVQGELSDETYNMLNNYLTGVADTTQRLADLADYFRDCEEPVVLVFFGDHMPWMGNGNSGYTDMGLNLDLGDQEGFMNYYSTRYYIWANDAAKAVTGNDFVGEGEAISPCFLMSKVFDLCGWEGPAYMQAMRTVSQRLPVIQSLGNYMEGGVITQTLSPEGAELAADFSSLEYYWQNHFAYADLISD